MPLAPGTGMEFIVSDETMHKAQRNMNAPVGPEGREDHDGPGDARAPRHHLLALERFLPYRLSVLSNRVSQEIATAYEEKFGLAVTEWRVIAVVGRYPELSASEVAERTAMDKVAVSRAVARLLERGLLMREMHDNDRRRSVLQLSEAGYAVYDAVVPVASAFEQDLLSVLDDAERAQLDALITKLGARYGL